MEYAKSVQPITALKTSCAQMIQQAREAGRPIVITQNGRATAVLQDVETFARQRQALLLLRFLAQGEQELRRGRGVPHATVAERVRKATRDLG